MKILRITQIILLAISVLFLMYWSLTLKNDTPIIKYWVDFDKKLSLSILFTTIFLVIVKINLIRTEKVHPVRLYSKLFKSYAIWNGHAWVDKSVTGARFYGLEEAMGNSYYPEVQKY